MQETQDEMIIICIGDSLTAGSPGFSGFPQYRGNPKSQYEYWLEKMIEKDFPESTKKEMVEVINYGVGGDTVHQIFRRFRDIIKIIPNPDYVIVWIGVNDIVGHQSPASDVVMGLTDMYRLIIETGAKVIPVECAPVTLPSYYNSRIKEENIGIKNLAKLMGVEVVPLYDALLNKEKNGLDLEYDMGDGVHFSIRGYQKIAEVIYGNVLKSILQTKFK